MQRYLVTKRIEFNQARILRRRGLERIAILASGGLDSAVLLADLALEATVFPIYVKGGLAWESHEMQALTTYLSALTSDNIQPLTILELPLRCLYGGHWSTTGENVPSSETPNIDVYLPGRNVLLIGLTAVWCALHDVHTIAIGSLDDNPFPDAMPQFFDAYGRVLSTSMSHEVKVVAPYRSAHKREIIARFPHLPLELTLTCIAPKSLDGALMHCGACNKCEERRRAFVAAGVSDKTKYAIP